MLNLRTEGASTWFNLSQDLMCVAGKLVWECNFAKVPRHQSSV